MSGRRIGVTALLVLGTLLWTAFGLGLWVKRQALDTDEWVATSGDLLQDEEVRAALGSFIVDQLYNSTAVEDRLKEALPPRLDALAAPAAAGLRQVAERNVPRVLGSAAAFTAWETANRVAHEKLLAIVEGDVKDSGVSLDLKSLLQEVAAGTGLPPEAVDKLPPDVANLQVASGDNLNDARRLLDLFETIVWVLLGLAVAAFAGAIALARDRRRTVLNVGGCLMFAAIALLALRRVGGNAVVEALADAPNAHAIADDVWVIGTRLMVDAAQGSFLFGLFVVLGAWLVGPGRRATAARRFSAYTLREHAGLTRAALGTVILLLVIWGPVPWTQNVWTIIIFTVIAFVWLERIRHRTLDEFPDEPPPRLPGMRRGPDTTAVSDPGGTTQ